METYEDGTQSWSGSFDTDSLFDTGGGTESPAPEAPPADVYEEESAAPTPTMGVAVAVVESNTQIQQGLVSMLGGGVSAFSDLGELTLRLSDIPVVVVLGPAFAEEGMLDEAERQLREFSLTATILVASELEAPLLRHAMRVGVKDVLSAPVEQSELLTAVQRVAADLTAISSVVAAPAAPTAPAAIPEDDSSEGGRLVTVFSTKGGAGKSMVASNLAVTLARRSDRPVCLVDADLQFGDVAVMLKLAPQHTIIDAVNNLERLDEQLLRSLLSVHEESGLLILAAPLEPAFADQIGGAEMGQIVDLLQNFCSHVVVDTPANFNDVVLGLIEKSDDVLLVAGMDIPNIKNVKIGLQTLRLLNTPMEKIRLVLNRANSKVKLDVNEVERTLQIKAEILVPSDIVVPQSVNKGIPVVTNAPKSGVAKAMEELTDLFMPAAKRRRR